MRTSVTPPILPVYEAEPAERRVLGTVQVDRETWWSGTLTLPESSDFALLALTRHGQFAPVDDAISFVVLRSELPALRVLLDELAFAGERLPGT